MAQLPLLNALERPTAYPEILLQYQLILSEDRDLDVLVFPRNPIQEQIEGPTPSHAPATPDALKEVRYTLRFGEVMHGWRHGVAADPIAVFH